MCVSICMYVCMYACCLVGLTGVLIIVVCVCLCCLCVCPVCVYGESFACVYLYVCMYVCMYACYIVKRVCVTEMMHTQCQTSCAAGSYIVEASCDRGDARTCVLCKAECPRGT